MADWWQQTRAAIPKVFRKKNFDSLVLLTTWNLWKERNQRTFDSKARTPSQLFALILEEVDSGITAGFRSLVSLTAMAS
jgi:hypothetical protein